MTLIDWLQHKYIRKGERIKIIRGGRSEGYDTVRAIEGCGKYAAVMLDPVGAIRRDGIQRGPDGEWTYSYDEGGE